MGLLSNLLDLLFNRKPKPPVPPPVPPPPIPPIPPPQPGDIKMELLAAHNNERRSRGLTEFSWNAKLQQAAQSHADFMAKRNVMKHFGMGDGDPWSRMKDAGYNMAAGGENIGAGQRDVPEIMRGWMNSSGHRAAILGSYKEYGGAVAKAANGTLYWCSVFGTPLSQEEGGLRVIGYSPVEGVEELGPIETENGLLGQPYEF